MNDLSAAGWIFIITIFAAAIATQYVGKSSCQTQVNGCFAQAQEKYRSNPAAQRRYINYCVDTSPPCNPEKTTAALPFSILGIGLVLVGIVSWLEDLDGPHTSRSSQAASKETGAKRKRKRKKPRYHQSAPERPGYMSLDEAIAWEKEHAKK